MTPKEKALRLYLNYSDLFILAEVENIKKLALLCVDEIIKANPCHVIAGYGLSEAAEYWHQVKEELQKM